MDILKNKAAESKDYISRYSNFPFYYHSLDNKYIQGLSRHLKTDISYVVIDVKQDTTLNFLANKYYGRPDYWWVIADFNRIQDPFLPLYPKFSKIKVPGIASIEYHEEMER